MRFFDELVVRALPLAPRAIVHHFARNYVAGESVQEALSAVRILNGKGMRATLDVLGEDVTNHDEARSFATSYAELLDAIRSEGLDANVSLKLTQFGLKLDPKACADNLRTVLRKAAEHDNFVRIDMEEASVTQATLDIYRSVVGEFPRVGVVLQAMLRRTLSDAEKLAADGGNARLCKGIYIEPETIAYQGREEVRESFRRSLRALLEGGAFVGIATHDDVLVDDAYKLLAERDYGGRYEFQMLLGVREPLRDSIVAAGHPLRVYVPFGEQWYAYSVRRLRENPQLAGYVLQALLRGEGWSGSKVN